MQSLFIFAIPMLMILADARFDEGFFLASKIAPAVYAGKADSLKEGDAAPMFVLPDIRTEEAVYLREFTGKTLRGTGKTRYVVVVSFWSTWCQPCKVEIPRLTQLAGELRGLPVKFFLVNTMEERSLREDSIRTAYLARGYVLQSLRDATGRVAKRYTVYSLPMVVVIDKFGVVRKVVRGFRENDYQQFAESLKKLAAEP